MRDTLPTTRMWKQECAIVNLDTSQNIGTHWVCYKKINDNVYYFDSFGNLRPPLELVRYFRGNNVFYNYTQHQTFDTTICGHLCLQFLKEKR